MIRPRQPLLTILPVLVLLVSHLCFAWPVVATTLPNIGQSDALQQGESAVVRAVLFWMEGCSHCYIVREQVLPPLRAQYGRRLEIFEIEVKDDATVARLYQATAALGLQREQVGVPLLIIGNRVLIGSAEIPRELPGLIEKHLAAGGVDIPPLPGLEGLAVAMTQPSLGKTSNGFIFAWAVMIILVASLVYAGFAAAVEFRGKQLTAEPAWLAWVTPVLCLMGLVVAIYLSCVEATATSAICGPVGDCNAVQSSPYARLFGILPVAVLGTFGYLAILAAWLWARLRTDALAAYAPIAIFAMTLFGVLFSAYLTYLELFVIHAVCSWCLVSAIIMALLFVVNVKPAIATVKTPEAV